MAAPPAAASAVRDVVRMATPASDISFGIAARSTSFGFTIGKTIVAGIATALGDTAGAPLRLAHEIIASAETITLTSLEGSRLLTKGSLHVVDAAHEAAGVETGGLETVAPHLHAISSISAMVAEFTRHLGPLSVSEIYQGLSTVSELQQLAEERVRSEEGFPLPYLPTDVVPSSEIEPLVPLMRLSLAAYGDLACVALGAIPVGANALETLCPGLVLVQAKTKGDLYHPGHMVVRDDPGRRVIVVIRGTFRPHDVTTDLMCMPEPNEAFGRGTVHGGMQKSAANVWSAVEAVVKTELEAHPTYRVVITGHSLGAGVAALLAMRVGDSLDAQCVGFAPPCTVSRELVNGPRIVAVVNADDMVCRFGLASTEDLRAAVLRVNRDDSMRDWTTLQREEMTQTKLYPAGRVLHMTTGEQFGKVVVRRRRGDWFDHLILTGSDIFLDHMPQTYLSRLQACL